jgi:hypothetical protein
MSASLTRLSRAIAAAALLTVAVLAGGCTVGSRTAPIAIECQVFYRASPGEQFEESTIVLGPANAARSAEFDLLNFGAQFVDDPGEGPALSIVVSDSASGTEIARQLYQIDRERGLSDQFIGGHGFTGLNYVFSASSSAEMQYFCRTDDLAG